MNQSKTYGLTHLAISVTDIERTLKFYQQVFEMEIMYHEKDMIQLTTPGSFDILVFEQKTKDTIHLNSGIDHFGFRLREAKDIDVIITKINLAGGTIIDKGDFVPGSPYVFFKDPDGYTVEVWYELIPTELIPTKKENHPAN